MNAVQNPPKPALPAACALHHRKPLARAELIERNRALVGFALAPLFRSYPLLTPADKDDLFSVGLAALCKAADRFDPARDFEFATFATTCIRGDCLKAITRSIGTGWGDHKAYRAGVVVASLDAPVTETDGASIRVDLVADPAAEEPFSAVLDTIADTDRGAALWAWVRATVTAKQARALWLVYGEGKTGQESGAVLGTTNKNVSGLVTSGLARLRKRMQEQMPPCLKS